MKRLNVKNKKSEALSHCGERPSAREVLEGARHHLTDQQYEFLGCQLIQGKRPARGRRWNEPSKRLAVALHTQSPKAYRFLRVLFPLPSIGTIRNTLKSISVEPGLNNSIFDGLEERVKGMNDDEKVCTLMFDEMSIKREFFYDQKRDTVGGREDYGIFGNSKAPAGQALTFMIKSIRGGWKQPLGYVLSKNGINEEMLRVNVKECICKLERIGVRVKVIVSDQCGVNRKLYKSLGVTTEKPYFCINDNKIWCMHDAPHLLKSVRNNLATYTIKSNDKLYKWAHIQDFFNKDSLLSIRLAPKLKKAHVNLSKFSKMRVNLAVQTLSRSVAAGMNIMATLDKISNAATDTAEFALTMNQLFDIFNSMTLRSVKKWRRAFCGNEEQTNFLRETADWIKTWDFVNAKTSIFCQEGWVLSINCLLGLWDDLKSNYGFKFILTNRLNQDPLENFFSVIRRNKGDNMDNPNAKQFCEAFRSAMCNSMIRPSKNANCMDDIGHFLVGTKAVIEANQISTESEDALAIPDIDDPDDVIEPNIVKENIINFIGGFLVRKIKKKTNCENCHASTWNSTPVLSHSTLMTYFKAQDNPETFGSLYVPSEHLYSALACMENSFDKMFNQIYHMPKILQRLRRSYKHHLSNMNFPDCHNIRDLIIDTFCKMRVYRAIKNMNEDIEKKAPSTNRKYKKVVNV